ncbi:MAG: DUF58 domain-containing protein [Clostridiales bacterium]|nr:DUF58 domain-containing protein [Clostridiales bacterium]
MAFLLGATCLVVGLAFGEREFFLIAAIFFLMLLIALLQAALQWPRIKVDVGSGQVVRGQVKNIVLSVQNPRPWPLFPVRMQISLFREGLLPETLAYHEVLLMGREKKSLEIEAICHHRGEYQVVLHQYCAEDVFGFFALSGRTLPPQSLLSLPRLDITAMEEQKHEAREDEESHQGLQGLQGQLSAESRAYQLGDALKSIHWKKSASRRELFSRLREYAADYSSCLLIDTRPFGQGEEALIYEDCLCEAAMNFLFFQLKRNQGIMLLPGPLNLQSPQGLDKAAALLAALPFDGEDTLVALQSLLESQRLPDTLFLMLGQLPADLTELLEQLIDQGCTVVCVAPSNYAEAVADEIMPYSSLITVAPAPAYD